MTKPTVEGLAATQLAMADRIDKMELLLQKMQNRLPLWATFAMTVMGSVITGLATYIAG